MLAASSSMQPVAVSTLPRQAIKQASSSSQRTAASTASTALSRRSRIAEPAASAASSPARAHSSCSGSSLPGRIEPAPPCTTRRHLVSLMAEALAGPSAPRQLTSTHRSYNYDIKLREAKLANDKVIALPATGERSASTYSGYAMLALLLLAILADAYGIQQLGTDSGTDTGIIVVIAATLVFILVLPGFSMMQPNP